MTKKEVILTYEGLKKLENELEILKTVKRRDIAERIKQALTFGDVSENSEYDEAKNEQAQIEAKILLTENMLKNAIVIDEDDVDTEVVSLGCKVTVYDEEYNENFEYAIVGTMESDVLNNKISNESPVGAALIGKRVGDILDVDVPIGKVRLTIIKIDK